MSEYQIRKRLNNNVVVVRTPNGSEKILMGKGLAFDKKVGDTIAKDAVEKTYRLTDKFQELLENIPARYLEYASAIVDHAKMISKFEISDNVIIALSDHIAMAVDRYENQVSMKNMMLWDVKRFYKSEYAIGQYGVALLNEKMKISLGEDEAGFIALHFVNAQFGENENTRELTTLIQEIESVVRLFLQIEVDEESLSYQRFITHVKFFAQRVLGGTAEVGDNLGDILLTIKDKYKIAYQCVGRISELLHKKYKYQLSGDEELYLCVHIQRIIDTSAKSSSKVD